MTEISHSAHLVDPADLPPINYEFGGALNTPKRRERLIKAFRLGYAFQTRLTRPDMYKLITDANQESPEELVRTLHAVMLGECLAKAVSDLRHEAYTCGEGSDRDTGTQHFQLTRRKGFGERPPHYVRNLLFAECTVHIPNFQSSFLRVGEHLQTDDTFCQIDFDLLAAVEYFLHND